jgi:hypothetical protein
MPDFNNVDPEAADAVESAPDPGPSTSLEGPSAGRGAITDALMSTDPSKPLKAVEDPWDPDRGGTTRIFRGLQKAFGSSGLPAIGDMVIGVVEIYADQQEADDLDGDDLEATELAIDEGKP